MSYLNIDTAPIGDFTKVVINLWFRIPKESIAACKAAIKGDKSLFDGIIPLVVMGKEGTKVTDTNVDKQRVQTSELDVYMLDGPLPGLVRTNISYEPFLYVLGTPIAANVVDQLDFNIPPPSFVAAPPQQGFKDQITITKSSDKPAKKEPTFIGVDCKGDKPTLIVNFETATTGKATGYAYNIALGMKSADPGVQDGFQTGTITVSYIFATLFIPPPPVFTGSLTTVNPPAGSAQIESSTYTDISDLYLDATGTIISDTIAVFQDHWHNVQISLDLKDIKAHGQSAPGNPSAKSGTYVDSAARLFVAVDDVNYTKGKLSTKWPDGYSDDNGVITEEAIAVIGVYPTVDADSNNLGQPTYTLSGPKIPVKDKPMGLPATTTYVKNIYRVEMGEFFMWPGKTLDLGDVANRRLFVDDKGEVVRDKKLAEDVLGIPSVKLHGSGSWKTGNNTGSTGKDTTTGEKIPSGQFTPVAKIKSWKPKPSLNGPQFPKT